MGNSGLGGGWKSTVMTGGFTLSVTDFFRRRKKDECFLAKVGGGACWVSLCSACAVCGTLGSDFSCDAMWFEPLGVVRGRVCEKTESISVGRLYDEAGDASNWELLEFTEEFESCG